MRVSGQDHAPAALAWRKEIGWALEPVWTQWRKEKALPLSGIESRSPPPSSVTMLTELPRLLIYILNK